MNKIEISVIIPTYNKSSRLILMLRSIENLKIVDSCEFIFINDNSNDNTKELLEKFKERNKKKIRMIVINNPSNLGRSIARNKGLREAKGKLIIFTDDDVLLHPEFICYHQLAHRSAKDLVIHGRIRSLPYLKFFKNPMTGELYKGGFAQGVLKSKIITLDMFGDERIKQYLKKNSKISKFELNIDELFEATTPEDSYVRWIGFTGGNVSILRTNLIEIDGFDNKMGKTWGCEDIETGYRLHLSGMKFKYEKDAKVYHLDHYRENINEIHNIAMEYFINKHQDEKIKKLQLYFNNELNSLVEWKNILKN